MAHQAADQDRLLNEIQAADLLRLSSRTLQAWRSQGIGPEYVKAGRAVRYRRSALIAWTEHNTIKPAGPTTSARSERWAPAGAGQ